MKRQRNQKIFCHFLGAGGGEKAKIIGTKTSALGREVFGLAAITVRM